MLDLHPAELHVWPVSTALSPEGVAPCEALLSPAEVERASKYRFQQDRHAFQMSRCALRILLAAYLDQPPERLSFVYEQKGKPSLAVESSIQFNISHSADLTLIALMHDCQVGVDVEQVRPLRDLNDMARRFFCAEEYAEMSSLADHEREQAFFRCWTRKEAYIKATGEGLQAPLDSFQVTLKPQDTARLIHINQSAAEAATWTLHNVDLGASHAAAVAYRGSPRTLRIMHQVSALELLSNFEGVLTNFV